MCPCGAVYVLDRTGHNLGEIYMDALQLVCKGDLDKALQLGPEDYESEDMDYDPASNTIGRVGSTGKCKLLFIKLINK